MSELFILDKSWKEVTSIIPFGFGRIAKRVLPKLLETFDIPFIIDNGSCEKEYMGIPVYTLENALPFIGTTKIVVMTKQNVYNGISQELKQKGYAEYHDYCILERFIAEWHYKYEGKCYLAKLNMVVTSRCSLKCDHCAMFVPHCAVKEDVTLESVRQNLESLFAVVDYIVEFTILGGEPFLHSQLMDMLLLIKNSYGDKIGQLVLITNGTIVPDEALLKIFAKYDIMISISDYTSVHSYVQKLDELKAALDSNHISYYVNSDIEWKDHGYPDNPCRFQDSEVARHMQLCGYNVHSVNEGKLYYCEVAWGARKHMEFEDVPDDYIDLKAIRNEPEAKLSVLKYCMGDLNQKGYMSFCKYCAGSGADNKITVPAGT